MEEKQAVMTVTGEQAGYKHDDDTPQTTGQTFDTPAPPSPPACTFYTSYSTNRVLVVTYAGKKASKPPFIMQPKSQQS